MQSGSDEEIMNFDTLIFILEMIGTIAFAISGVMVAKERKMDIFGAIFLGCTTAVGGGVLRDLILGRIPPEMFVQPFYVTLALITCILDFIIEKYQLVGRLFRKGDPTGGRTNAILNVADSIGLAAFVVAGCMVAVNAGFGGNHFLTAFVGTLTGIGGGILRDMMAGQVPLIFSRRVYGIAAIIGAVLYTEAAAGTGAQIPAALASMGVTVLIRFLAIRYHWNLPSFRK